jgi:hypothetical protein
MVQFTMNSPIGVLHALVSRTVSTGRAVRDSGFMLIDGASNMHMAYFFL